MALRSRREPSSMTRVMKPVRFMRSIEELNNRRLSWHFLSSRSRKNWKNLDGVGASWSCYNVAYREILFMAIEFDEIDLGSRNALKKLQLRESKKLLRTKTIIALSWHFIIVRGLCKGSGGEKEKQKTKESSIMFRWSHGYNV